MTSARVKRLDVADSYLAANNEDGLGKVLAKAVIDVNTGELLADANQILTTDLLTACRTAGVTEVEIIYANDLDCGPFISDTLRKDADDTKGLAFTAEGAQQDIYRMMRPGEPPTKEAAEQLFKNLFFNTDRYDLSMVGRMKLNRRLGRSSDEGPSHLTQEDIIDVLRVLVELKNGRGETDDIDNLGNRRVRSVGELVENQFRVGLVRSDLCRIVGRRRRFGRFQFRQPTVIVPVKFALAFFQL